MTGTWSAVTAALALAAAPAHAEPVPVAHRGAYAATGLPENTRPAFEAAYAAGAWVETDVWLTADHVPIVSHDSTLTRNTNCDGWTIRQHTAADIQATCRTADGQPPLTLRQAAWIVYHNPGQHLQPELKGGWPVDAVAGLPDVVAPVLGRTWFANDRSASVLEKLRDHAPTARTVWKPTRDDDENGRTTPATAHTLGVDVVMRWPWQWSAADVTRYRAAGLRPWARMTDDPALIRHLGTVGVGAYLTDTVGAGS